MRRRRGIGEKWSASRTEQALRRALVGAQHQCLAPTVIGLAHEPLEFSTAPRRCFTDVGDVMAKFGETADGTDALVSELIGTRVAALVGARVFDFGVGRLANPGDAPDDIPGVTRAGLPFFVVRWDERGSDIRQPDDELVTNVSADSAVALIVADTLLQNIDRWCALRGDRVHSNLRNYWITPSSTGGWDVVAFDFSAARFWCWPHPPHDSAKVFGAMPALLNQVNEAAAARARSHLGSVVHLLASAADNLPPEWSLPGGVQPAAIGEWLSNRADWLVRNDEFWQAITPAPRQAAGASE